MAVMGRMLNPFIRSSRWLVALCLLGPLVFCGHQQGVVDASIDEPRSGSADLLYALPPDPSEAISVSPGHKFVWMEVTAYCPCPRCCGPHARGITASGRPVSYNEGHFVAADTDRLPFGSKVIVPGYAAGQPIEVIDRGAAIKGNRLDVFFPAHDEAKSWGRRWVRVEIVE